MGALDIHASNNRNERKEWVPEEKILIFFVFLMQPILTFLYKSRNHLPGFLVLIFNIHVESCAGDLTAEGICGESFCGAVGRADASFCCLLQNINRFTACSRWLTLRTLLRAQGTQPHLCCTLFLYILVWHCSYVSIWQFLTSSGRSRKLSVIVILLRLDMAYLPPPKPLFRSSVFM